VGGGDEFHGLDASITIVPSPEVLVETVNWHLRADIEQVHKEEKPFTLG
jgi:hypothetical protein